MFSVNVHVLHLVNFFKVGGLEKVIKELVVNCDLTIQNSVCVIRQKGYFSTTVEAQGIPVFEIDADIKKDKIWFFDRILKLKRIVNENHIDIIHCHDMAAWHLAILLKMLGLHCKIVFTKHGDFELSDKKILFQAHVFSRLTHRIVSVATDIEQTCRQSVRINKKKIKTIFNGIDIQSIQHSLISKSDARKRLQVPASSFVTGTITRFFQVKNIEMQMDMVKELKDCIPNLIHIIVAPIGPIGKTYVAKIKERRLDSHIKLLGFRDDIPEVLSSFDVFLLTSFSEGTSMALLEAMAAGCIPVVSSVGGNKKVVTHGVNGCLFDVNDLDELCQCLKNLAADPTLSARLKANLTESVARYGIDHMIFGYKQLYTQIMKEGLWI